MTSVEPLRIVLVEDNDGDVRILRYALDRQNQPYRLDVLKDGEAALRYVEAWPGRMAESCSWVLVLDVHIPRHDGMEVLKALRQCDELSSVRIIVVTGVTIPSEQQKILNLGVEMYWPKPRDLAGVHNLAMKIFAISDGRSFGITTG